MKQFFTKLAILSIPVIIACALPAVIDPYNVFHYKNIRDNGVEPNRNYIKTRYILDNPDKFNAYLFGSSRVGGIDVGKINQYHCYNMYYSVGLPKEHFENLQVMIHNGVIPEFVMVGVDNLCYEIDPILHKTDWQRMPHPSVSETNTMSYMRFLTQYFNPKLLSSIPIIISYNGEDNDIYGKRFYENGSRTEASDIRYYSKMDWNKAEPSGGNDIRIENAINEIQQIINICKENGIKLIIFTNPMHIITYKFAAEHGHLDFLEQLANITGYYNFPGINDITVNNENYFDTSHYKLSVGDMIIDAIFNSKVNTELLSQGFGYYVTKENRDDFINMLRAQIKE
jgi:hypothetical protein